MSRRCFITFEGGEGAGKTTIIELLRHELEARGLSVMVTREPGGVEIAEQIRAIILDRGHTTLDSRTEALLYAAARRQHLAEKVMPALREEHIVLCDRFIDSSLAYQGYARGIGVEDIMEINRFAIGEFTPDLTLLLDITPEAGLKRIRQHDGREINRLDLEDISFHNRVREGYLQLVDRFPQRIKLVDAGLPVAQVLEAVRAHVWPCIDRKRMDSSIQ